MECKIVRLWIDGLEEHEQTETLENHLDTCQECQAYLKEAHSFEDELNDMFNNQHFDESINRKILDSVKPRKRKAPILIAASLIIVMLVTFNAEIMSFAEKLPLIQDILSLFDSSDQVDFATDLGYPVQEFFSENGEYKLYFKDIFIDSTQLDMQFTAVDKDGQLPDDLEITIRMPRLTKDSHSFSKINEDVWFSFSYNVYNKVGQLESLEIEVDLKKDGEILISEIIDVDISHLKAFETQEKILNQIIELPTGKVMIESVIAGPTAFIVKYKPLEQHYSVDTRLNMTLIDSEGNQYYTTSENWSSESPTVTTKFKYSSLNQTPESFTLIINSYSYQDITIIDKIHDESLVFSHNDTEFTLSAYEFSGSDKRGYLRTEDRIDAKLYPDLAFREEENWKMAIMSQRSVEYVKILDEWIEEALGPDLKDITDEQIEEFVEYIKENHDISLDVEGIKKFPMLLTHTGDHHYKTTRIFLVNEERFQMNTILDLEGLEIGSIGERQRKEIDTQIEINFNE